MKSLGFLLLWLLGSAAAVSVAFAGIAVVDAELINPPAAQVANLGDPTPPPPAPAGTSEREGTSPQVSSDRTTTGELDTAPDSTSGSLANSSATSAAQSPADDQATSEQPRSTSTQVTTSQSSDTTAAASTSQSPATTTQPTTSRPPATNSPTTTARPTTTVATTTTAQPTTTVTTTTTSAPTTTTPPTTSAPAAQVVTFNLVGGTTAISFSSGNVAVLWATPKPGFDVEVKPGSTDVRVEFESDGHKSRIDAWWSGGPKHEIREDAD